MDTPLELTIGELRLGLAQTEVEVVDLFSGGAQLACLLPVALGQRATLRIWSLADAAAIEFPCQVVSRCCDCLGVAFLGTPRWAAPPSVVGWQGE